MLLINHFNASKQKWYPRIKRKAYIIMKFICNCGYETDLSVQSTVSAHMLDCSEYQNSSAIHQAIKQQNLVTVEQLLIFKADLLSQLEAIRKILDQQGYSLKRKASILDYTQFTQPKRADDTEKPKQVTKQKRKRLNNQKLLPKEGMSFTAINGLNPTQKSYDESDSMGVLKTDVFKGLEESFDMNEFSEEMRQSKKKTSNETQQATGDTCAACGRSKSVKNNQIYQIECGHSMCQECFVDLYRSGEPLNCPRPNCEKLIDRAFIHKSAVNQDTSFCTLCDKRFIKNLNVRRHLQSVHMGEERKFCCNLCTKALAKYEDILIHKETKHVSDKPSQFLQEEVILLESSLMDQYP